MRGEVTTKKVVKVIFEEEELEEFLTLLDSLNVAGNVPYEKEKAFFRYYNELSAFLDD